MTIPASFLQLRSEFKSNGSLELSLAEVPTPEPGENEVLVRVEAAPINPSDLGLIFGAADMTTAKQSGSAARPVVTADVPERMRQMMAPRVDQSLPQLLLIQVRRSKRRPARREANDSGIFAIREVQTAGELVACNTGEQARDLKFLERAGVTQVPEGREVNRLFQ